MRSRNGVKARMAGNWIAAVGVAARTAAHRRGAIVITGVTMDATMDLSATTARVIARRVMNAGATAAKKEIAVRPGAAASPGTVAHAYAGRPFFMRPLRPFPSAPRRQTKRCRP